ncbi:hypothetical protein [Pseudonocardia sp. KRD291]|uniref:hypothetical protein n=1 Tax=Pseudonocardia sp. KRD291 TaxID=2792007 RepID=UPI001C4A66A2|nr:hypothetical protein [Pseudonocardia sp. KRD291]MBW0103186.1 hypothetical protein [Pseudonocardia sp. KRD291]
MTIEMDHEWTPFPVVTPNIYLVDWRVEDRCALIVYGVAAERDAALDVLASDDAGEGASACLQRRPPRFLGR